MRRLPTHVPFSEMYTPGVLCYLDQIKHQVLYYLGGPLSGVMTRGPSAHTGEALSGVVVYVDSWGTGAYPRGQDRSCIEHVGDVAFETRAWLQACRLLPWAEA